MEQNVSQTKLKTRKRKIAKLKRTNEHESDVSKKKLKTQKRKSFKLPDTCKKFPKTQNPEEKNRWIYLVLISKFNTKRITNGFRRGSMATPCITHQNKYILRPLSSNLNHFQSPIIIIILFSTIIPTNFMSTTPLIMPSHPLKHLLCYRPRRSDRHNQWISQQRNNFRRIKPRPT